MTLHPSAMLRALKAIEDIGPEATNKQIIATASITAAAISSAIDNLLSSGYVDKVGSHTTRRLYITQEGRDLLHPPQPNIRNCLDCKRGFVSTWEGNRVCPSCKENETWRAGGLSEYSVAGARP